jgi:hypothetical protein
MIKTRNVLHSASIFAVLGCVLGSAATAQTSQTAQNNAMQAPTSTSQPVVHDLPANVPGHTEYLDYLNGFRGIKFGTPVSQFKNLEVLHDRKDVKAYSMKGDDMNIGNVTVTQIVYSFVNDKFYAVSIHADGGFNGSNLLKVFQAAFGQGAHPEGSPTKTFWAGKVAGAHFYEDADEHHEVRGWVGNLEIQKEYDKVMQESFIAAASQL